MKLFKAVCLLAFVMLLAACETKEIKLYPSIEESRIFEIANDGSNDIQQCINDKMIQERIDDLEQDGDITAVMVEGIWVDAFKDSVQQAGITTAQSVSASLVLKGWDGKEYVVVENLIIDVTKKQQRIYLNSHVKKEAILKLKTMIFEFATFSNGDNHEICFELKTKTIPEVSYVNSLIEVFVKVAVEYSQEVKMI